MYVATIMDEINDSLSGKDAFSVMEDFIKTQLTHFYEDVEEVEKKVEEENVK